MGHCASFALHNKSEEGLLGMFILCFYPGLIFALNCDNSLTVFMLKASCLCHERSFSSISTDNSQNRNSGILMLTLQAPGSACAPVSLLCPPSTHVFSKCQYTEPKWQQNREQSGPNPATAAHLGRGKRWEGGTEWVCKWKDWKYGYVLKMSGLCPGHFDHHLYLVKVLPSDIIWWNISEWAARSLPLILIAHFAATDNAGETLII